MLTLLVFVTVAVGMTVVWFGHAVVTGTVLPEPDAPPAKAAYMAEQSGINGWLFVGAGLMWLVTFGAAVGFGVWRLVNRKRTRPEGKR